MREARAEEERREQEREVEAQGWHESEVKAQGGQKEDAISMHEESHVSNRHMTWWQNAWSDHTCAAPEDKTWRAARQPAEQVRDEKCAGETRREDGKREGRREDTQNSKSNDATLHLILHVSQAQQQQQQQEHRSSNSSNSVFSEIVLQPLHPTTGVSLQEVHSCEKHLSKVQPVMGRVIFTIKVGSDFFGASTAPALSYAAPAPVVEYVQPALAVSNVALSQVMQHIAPAPVDVLRASAVS